MSALPLTEVEPTYRDIARATAPRRREAVPALRLAPPQPSARTDRPGTAPGWDLTPVDPRIRADLQGWVERYVQSALEAVAGERPPSQLARWTSTRVQQDLIRRTQLALRAGGRILPGVARNAAGHPRTQVNSAKLSFLTATTVEAAVHVRHGDRSRAVAAQFQWLRQRWVCTALDFC